MKFASIQIFRVIFGLFIAILVLHPQQIMLKKSAKAENKVRELCPEKPGKPYIANGKPFRSRTGRPVQVPLRPRCQKP